MKSTTRHLKKIISSQEGLDAVIVTGEDLDLLLETLRDLKKLGLKKDFLFESSKLDLDITPEVFHRLLEIPEIDIVETPTKSGDVERISLKATRYPDDPVSVSDVNSILRELNRDLSRLKDLTTKNFSKLFLKADMTSNLLQPCANWIVSLKALSEKTGGYLFSPIKAKKIEDEFQRAFPNCVEAHPLRAVLPLVEKELSFHGSVLGMEKKWSPLGIDFFGVLRRANLPQILENLQETGSLLWNIVYNGQRLRKSLKVLGIHFGNFQSLTQNNQLN